MFPLVSGGWDTCFKRSRLFPHLTGKQNIEYGLNSLPEHERASRIGEVAESFGISAILQRRPSQMSGGERQRVALARALVTRPRAFLLDEPMTALDRVTKSRILDDLRRWNDAHSVPILYVTHEREEVYALGDRVILLESGRVVADGTPHEVLRRPQYESVAQLAGFENLFDCTVVESTSGAGHDDVPVRDSKLTLEAPLTRVERRRQREAGHSCRRHSFGKRPADRPERQKCDSRTNHCAATAGCHGHRGGRLRREVHRSPYAGRPPVTRAGGGPAVWLVLKTYSCHVLQHDTGRPKRFSLSASRRSLRSWLTQSCDEAHCGIVHTVHTGDVVGCCKAGWTSDHPEVKPIRRVCMKLVSVSAAGSTCLAEVSRNANRRRSQSPKPTKLPNSRNTRSPSCLPPKWRWRRSPPAWGRSS